MAINLSRYKGESTKKEAYKRIDFSLALLCTLKSEAVTAAKKSEFYTTPRLLQWINEGGKKLLLCKYSYLFFYYFFPSYSNNPSLWYWKSLEHHWWKSELIPSKLHHDAAHKWSWPSCQNDVANKLTKINFIKILSW